MKKKSLLAILAVMAAAALTESCQNINEPSSFEESAVALSAGEIAEGAADTIEAADFADYSLVIDLSGTVSQNDGDEELSMVISMAVRTVTDPLSYYILENIDMSYLDEGYNQSVEIYLVSEDDKLYLYTGYDDVWTKSETASSFETDSSSNIFREIADGNIAATVSDNIETLDNGRGAYVLSVSVPGRYMSDVIDLSLGNGIGLFGDVDYSDMSMDASLYIYTDTLQPALISVSCAEMGEAMFKDMFGASESSFTVNNYSIECTYNEFNAIDEITVPDKVKTSLSNTGVSDSPRSDNSDISAVEDSIGGADDIIYNSLTGDLNFSFDLTYADTNLRVPMKYSDLTDAGWIVNDSADGSAAAGDYDLETMYLGDASMDVYIYNFGSKDASYSKCTVVGMCITAASAAGEQVILPDGIILSESTLDDVLAAYGKPANSYVDESMIYLDYANYDTGKIICLYFDYESRVLNEIDIQYVAEE